MKYKVILGAMYLLSFVHSYALANEKILNDTFVVDVYSNQVRKDGCNRIEEACFLHLGGIEQWITIRGDNDTNPVLLLVHGGPGDVQSPLINIYAAYEHDYVLVQWDQRGSGRTYGKYKEQTPNMTLDQVVDDGIELVEYLKGRFRGNKIIILGHSWGTAIATGMVRKIPSLFSAYVGTGQIASWPESVQWQFDYLKTRASAANDTFLLMELLKIGRPDPDNTKQYFGFARSLRQYFNATDSAWLAGLRIVGEKVLSKNEFDDVVGGMIFSGEKLLLTQTREDLSSSAVEFKVPYYLILGKEDISTPAEPAIKYFGKIKAPVKKLMIIEKGGHFALVTHTKEFIEALRGMLCLDRIYPDKKISVVWFDVFPQQE